MQGWQRWMAAGLVLATAACSESTSTGPLPSIGLSVSPGTVTLEQGASGAVTAQLTRGGEYEGAVSLTVSGAPTGVTVTADPSSLSGATTSSTISIAVAESASPGNYPLTVQAAGAGVDAATASVTLTVTERPAGSFTIRVSPAAVSITQGMSASTEVQVTRTNFDGNVTFAATNLPAGVTASFAPTSTTANTSAVTLQASAGATPGTYTVTFTGTSGTEVETADLGLTVVEAASGTDVSWTFCEATGMPVWVAYRDGTGNWIRVPANGDTFEFSLSSGMGGIAFVTADNGASDLTVYYGTADELTLMGSGQCEGSGLVKTLNGSVAGLGATDQTWISMGGAATSVFGATGTNFTLEGVQDGPTDLFASRVLSTVSGSDVTFDVDKFILRRDLNLADGATIPVLDFGAAEAFDPVFHTVTLANTGSDLTYLTTGYFTDNGAASAFFSGVPGTGTMLEYAGIPASRQEAGDLHLLTAFAVPDAQNVMETRAVLEMFNVAEDKTLTMGPVLGSVSAQTLATTPYARLELEYIIQPQYDRYWIASFSQSDRSVNITATADYVGSGPVVLAIPDFSTTDGWNNMWGPAAGVNTDWGFFAIGWDAEGGIITSPFLEGGTIYTGTRTGTITP